MRATRATVTVVGLLAASAVLGGCSGGIDSGSSGTPSPSALEIVGTWGEEGPDSPHLTFDEDGTLSGSDGCNRLVGQWEQDGDTATFGSLATTLKECVDMNTWLAGAASATVEDGELVLADADGETLGTLPPAGQ